MDQETRQCQNCKQDFVIEPEDFAFYEKMKVPAPTFCPDCRLQRRAVWRNERSLHKRKCDAPGHNEIILSAIGSPKYKVYDLDYWWSDKWDATGYQREYDFSRPFFTQFEELLKSVPQDNLFATNNINSPYSNGLANSKNCYLVSSGSHLENVLYSSGKVIDCRDSLDMYLADKLELCYEDIFCKNSYRLFYSQNCESCTNSYFLYDCKGCTNCMACAGLRNKKNYIFNKEYSDAEYKQILSGYDFGSYDFIQEMEHQFRKFLLAFPRKYANILRCERVTGDNLADSKNCQFAFDSLAGSENCKYIIRCGPRAKDTYDCLSGSFNSELVYEGVSSTLSSSSIKFTAFGWGCSNIEYCFNCHTSHNLFGCTGLRSKEYCILNRQYSKEEYFALRERIIQQMNQMPYIDDIGRTYVYGEFFPVELSPYGYNETIAYEFFPLKKNIAEATGFKWHMHEDKNYKIDIVADSIPDNINRVGEEITGKVIECAHKGLCDDMCSGAFKVVPQELDLYKKIKIPIPHLCPNCRHYERLKKKIHPSFGIVSVCVIRIIRTIAENVLMNLKLLMPPTVRKLFIAKVAIIVRSLRFFKYHLNYVKIK